NLGYDAKKISQQVKTELISRNRVGEDNELVPFVGMEGEMRINKIKILNHKWIIADFTDGSTWGEIFITYTVNENGGLIFETREALLYPKN
ncbi:MAG TPA: hypothetical protein VFM60_06535, partial [Salinimicrobium sp.]|nr:hypothetical protein [Salinimicrobium sp.]